MSYSSPCKGCNKRYVGCHSDCEDYLKFAENRKAIREERAAQRQADDDYYSTILSSKYRGKKSKDRKF